MNRAMRRAAERMARAAPLRQARSKNHVRLGAMPWKIDATWAPLEQALSRMELDGTVDSAQGKPVLYDHMNGGWYEIAPAIEGLVEFHEVAANRHGWDTDLGPLRKIAAKLKAGSPVFQADMDAVRLCMDQCKRRAALLTLGEAQDILTGVRVGIEMEKQQGKLL